MERLTPWTRTCTCHVHVHVRGVAATRVVHVLGAAVCMAVCVAAFIALLRTGRWGYGALSVAALATGLLVQERPLLTIGYLVLIRYLFFAPARTSTIARWLAREVTLWAPYAVVIVTYLIYRLFFFAAFGLALAWTARFARA